MTVEHVAWGLFDRRRVRVPMARFCPVRSQPLPAVALFLVVAVMACGKSSPSTDQSVQSPTQSSASNRQSTTSTSRSVPRDCRALR